MLMYYGVRCLNIKKGYEVKVRGLGEMEMGHAKISKVNFSLRIEEDY